MTQTHIVRGLVVLVVLGAPAPLVANQWFALFDGQTLEGWRTADGQSVTKGWEVIDGAIHLNLADGRGGNIVTAQEYDNYQLLFEWKNSPRGNSGVKYRVREYGGRTLGCEYQILDPRRPGLPTKGDTGSLYDVYEPMVELPLNPVDQFNRSRIVVQGRHIEHWLNGVKIVDAEVGGQEWQQRIAQSKFADVEGFGEAGPGKIMLTDHGSQVWYRNIFLKPLPSCDGDLSSCTGQVVCHPNGGPRVRIVRRPFRSRFRFTRCR